MDYKNELKDLIKTVFQEGASDLHLSEGKKPTVRVSGMLLPLVKREILDKEMMSGILSELVSKENRDFFFKNKELDFSSNNVGKKIASSNKNIIKFFAELGIHHSARTISVFVYSPEFKPLWKIEKAEEAEPTIKPFSTPSEEAGDPSLFYMESQLEDFLVENWDKTEFGNKYDLIEEDGELVSQQFRTDIGIIDILAKDRKTGQYVVIELKKNQTSDDTVGQLTRYMGWLEEHKTGGEPTKGIIIAGHYDQRLYYALRILKDVEIYLYQVDFKLREFKE